MEFIWLDWAFGSFYFGLVLSDVNTTSAKTGASENWEFLFARHGGVPVWLVPLIHLSLHLGWDQGRIGSLGPSGDVNMPPFGTYIFER